jgi:hypothetical protein
MRGSMDSVIAMHGTHGLPPPPPISRGAPRRGSVDSVVISSGHTCVRVCVCCVCFRVRDFFVAHVRACMCVLCVLVCVTSSWHTCVRVCMCCVCSRVRDIFVAHVRDILWAHVRGYVCLCSRVRVCVCVCLRVCAVCVRVWLLV